MGETVPTVDPTEAELIGRLRHRDAGALEILMQRHGARVYRVALGITRNEADAEEVVQDVFLSLFEKIASFEETAEILHEPVSSVKSRLHRARMALREQLKRVMSAAQAAPCR